MVSTKTALVFQVNVPSSPAHIAAVARMMDEMLQAMTDDLEPHEVTMVVENFSSRSTIRPRTPVAVQAVALVIQFLINPTAATLSRNRQLQELASVLASRGKEFSGLGARFSTNIKRRPIAVIDDRFLKTMEALSRREEEAQVRRQGIQTVSPILRIGRLHVDSTVVSARVVVDTQEIDIPVDSDCIQAAYDAAKTNSLHLIDIEACYRVMPSTPPELIATKSTIVSVGRKFAPVSGMALINVLHEFAPSIRYESVEDSMEPKS